MVVLLPLYAVLIWLPTRIGRIASTGFLTASAVAWLWNLLTPQAPSPHLDLGQFFIAIYTSIAIGAGVGATSFHWTMARNWADRFCATLFAAIAGGIAFAVAQASLR